MSDINGQLERIHDHSKGRAECARCRANDAECARHQATGTGLAMSLIEVGQARVNDATNAAISAAGDAWSMATKRMQDRPEMEALREALAQLFEARVKLHKLTNGTD